MPGLVPGIHDFFVGPKTCMAGPSPAGAIAGSQVTRLRPAQAGQARP